MSYVCTCDTVHVCVVCMVVHGGRGEVTCNYCTCPHSGDCKAYESYNPDVEDGKKKKAMK